MKTFKLSLVIVMSLFVGFCKAQSVPAEDENIPYLVTFGNQAEKSWGDDDFSQTFFFTIPKTQKGAFFIRVFDPGTGGELDEARGPFNTKTKFSVYGGKGTITNKDARGTQPVGNYKSGNLYATKTFTTDYDKQWYSFGPFNPTSGEFSEQFGGYVFKVVADGISGNDGNLYKYFMSVDKNTNKAVEGGNAFTFEYTFRMHDDPNEVSHLYPFIDDKVVSVKQANFDWDNDGDLKFVSKMRYSVQLKRSGQANWARSQHKIYQKERQSTLDVQFHKNKAKPAKNNNISFYITNQYNEALPFYVIPIGGVPKPKTSATYKPIRK